MTPMTPTLVSLIVALVVCAALVAQQIADSGEDALARFKALPRYYAAGFTQLLQNRWMMLVPFAGIALQYLANLSREIRLQAFVRRTLAERGSVVESVWSNAHTLSQAAAQAWSRSSIGNSLRLDHTWRGVFSDRYIGIGLLLVALTCATKIMRWLDKIIEPSDLESKRFLIDSFSLAYVALAADITLQVVVKRLLSNVQRNFTTIAVLELFMAVASTVGLATIMSAIEGLYISAASASLRQERINQPQLVRNSVVAYRPLYIFNVSLTVIIIF